MERPCDNWYKRITVLSVMAFVFADLFTTFLGLNNGFVETAPYAYLFGTSITTVMLWLTLQKVAFVMLIEWLLNKISYETKLVIGSFAYGVLFAYGLAVTLQNLRYLL